MNGQFGKTIGEIMLEAMVYRFWAGALFKALIGMALIKYIFWG